MSEETASDIDALGCRPDDWAPDFDGLARAYRWMEYASFGPWLWWCRCAFLGELGGRRRTLILGDGDGRFAARLLAANPEVHIHAVDASRAMLRRLVSRAGRHAERVEVERADIRNWQPVKARIDLIVTHFFLDCLTTAEVASLALRLRRSVAPGARWVVSEFAVPENWFGRQAAGPIVRALYRAFGLLTGMNVRQLPDHAAALSAAGFTRTKCRTWLKGMLVSELWSADPD